MVRHPCLRSSRACYRRVADSWPDIKAALIAKVDRDFGVFEGTTFKQKRFAEYLYRNGIRWPARDSGTLAMDERTFRSMAKLHPELAPLHELRVTLSQMKLHGLAVGPDDRNRCMLSPFRSKTGRNQPSNVKSVFGPATWVRSFVRPEPGNAIAYLDYAQQEFGIAAALSGDRTMQEAYLSGDPYLGFAKAAKAVPPEATKQSHPVIRERFKVTTLGVQYGMSEVGLANQLGVTTVEARYLLELHRQAFPVYWHWSDAAVNYAMLTGSIQTVFGWTLHVTPDTKARSLANFPMQANGAEILRLACCLATERGIHVCAPIHDALLVEGPCADIDDIVAETQRCMCEAGEIVLNGFHLSSDAKVISHPDRYMDPRGRRMWDTVMEILDDPPQPCKGSPGKDATPG